MVDLTTDSSGKAQARLLDLDWGDRAPPTPGGSTLRTRRSGPESKHAALDPSRGDANALRDSLSDAVQVLDAVHVVKLGTAVVNEVRRRVQQEQLGHRGHQDDPLYKIRGLLRHGAEHLTERQRASSCPVWTPATRTTRSRWPGPATSSSGRSTAAHNRTKARRALAEKVIASFPSCPIPEVARLGRTLRAWRPQVLAYFDTGGVSNGGTEAINMLIEKGRRLAHGSANLKNYRPRMLLATESQRSQRPGTSPR